MALTGDNGILTKTKEAKEKKEKANELEQVQLAVISATMSNNTLSENALKTALANNLNKNIEQIKLIKKKMAGNLRLINIII